MLAFSILTLSLCSLSALSAPVIERRSSTTLTQLALQKTLSDASPIFGPYTSNHTSTASWMKKYPDSTPLISMNIPGTHETSTWNYTLTTQVSLSGIVSLDGGLPIYPPEIFRCQTQSIIASLNAGIRVFDLRFAFDITNSTLVFWHSQALQSQTATVDDVLFGFYHWLDQHPSETVLLSFKYEGSTTAYAQNNAAVQLAIFDTLTSPTAQKYFLQTQNEFGTLGEARGKITLLRRFDLDQLPQSYSDAMPGIPFSPALWTDNDPDISLAYNTAQNLTAYIEDRYEIDVASGTPISSVIATKVNATTTHLLKAASEEFKDSLFWSFASGEGNTNTPIETPEILAVGNGTDLGVNQQLVNFLQGMKGKRVGIVMFDFWETPGNLIETFLSL